MQGIEFCLQSDLRVISSHLPRIHHAFIRCCHGAWREGLPSDAMLCCHIIYHSLHIGTDEFINMVVWYVGFLYGYQINPDTPPLFVNSDNNCSILA